MNVVGALAAEPELREPLLARSWDFMLGFLDLPNAPMEARLREFASEWMRLYRH